MVWVTTKIIQTCIRLHSSKARLLNLRDCSLLSAKLVMNAICSFIIFVWFSIAIFWSSTSWTISFSRTRKLSVRTWPDDVWARFNIYRTKDKTQHSKISPILPAMKSILSLYVMNKMRTFFFVRLTLKLWQRSFITVIKN